MENLNHTIKSLAAKYLPEIIEIRRYLHTHPELSGEEYQTAEFVAGKLRELGIKYQEWIAKTGIVGLIEGGKPGDGVIALRADMDALPIREENEIDYKSAKPGIMHACGHDVHMACLLGASKIIIRLKDQLNCSVKLIFQPSEEKYPGGAKMMISEGVLENPRPDLIIGQHVYPELEAGKIGMRSGHYMASTDEVYITVKGKGGHAAIPHKVVDPILIASHIIVALQQIVSRNACPTDPTVLSFGRIIGDGRVNIIPDEVRIEGIIRTFNDQWRAEIPEKIRKIAGSIAKGMGGTCEVVIADGYPALYNDPDLTGRIRKFSADYLGEENVADLDMRMTAEDFSYYALEIPGCFYRLGTMNNRLGITSNLHTSTFNVDESSLETGMGLLAWLVFALSVRG